MDNNNVEYLSVEFAIRTIKLYQFLCNEKKEYVMSKQVLRSGTSIGANIVEAECGISKKDFLSKMYIAYKECAETSYWLLLLYRTEYITEEQYTSVKVDCDTLMRMLSSITKTTEENMKNGESE